MIFIILVFTFLTLYSSVKFSLFLICYFEICNDMGIFFIMVLNLLIFSYLSMLIGGFLIDIYFKKFPPH